MGTLLFEQKEKKRKQKEFQTANVADVLFSEGNETSVEHIHKTIKKGFLL